MSEPLDHRPDDPGAPRRFARVEVYEDAVDALLTLSRQLLGWQLFATAATCLAALFAMLWWLG